MPTKSKGWNELLHRQVKPRRPVPPPPKNWDEAKDGPWPPLAKPRKATGAGATIPAGELEGHMDRQRKGLNSDPERVLQEFLALLRDCTEEPRFVKIEAKKIVVESQGIVITITAK